MGIFTHHINDANVHNNGNGTAFVWSALDNVEMNITKSGYLQPPVEQRISRFFYALVIGFFILFIKICISSSYTLDTFFDVGRFDITSCETILWLMAMTVWACGVYIFLFQRAYVFGGALWHIINTTMMFLFFIVVGCMTIVYLVLAIGTLIQWISHSFKS